MFLFFYIFFIIVRGPGASQRKAQGWTGRNFCNSRPSVVCIVVFARVSQRTRASSWYELPGSEKIRNSVIQVCSNCMPLECTLRAREPHKCTRLLRVESTVHARPSQREDCLRQDSWMFPSRGTRHFSFLLTSLDHKKCKTKLPQECMT